MGDLFIVQIDLAFGQFIFGEREGIVVVEALSRYQERLRALKKENILALKFFFKVFKLGVGEKFHVHPGVRINNIRAVNEFL